MSRLTDLIAHVKSKDAQMGADLEREFKVSCRILPRKSLKIVGAVICVWTKLLSAMNIGHALPSKMAFIGSDREGAQQRPCARALRDL